MSFHWGISTFKLGSGLNDFQTSQDDSQRSQHFLHHVRQASDFFLAVQWFERVGENDLRQIMEVNYAMKLT